MLASLTVRDIVLIEKAELHFAPGLNVLTGETGAGKSILLDALGLAAGERGQGRSTVRAGADVAAVTAMFDVEAAHPARALLKESDLDGGSDDIILRRTVTADGRSRAFVNDSAVGVQLAREIGGALVEVHGQTDDRGLFDMATHRLLLDAFGGHEALANDVARLWAALAAADVKCASLKRAQATAAEEIEYLTHAARELGELAPEAGEEETLAAKRALLMNAGRLAEEIGSATAFVAGDAGAEVKLGAALRRLSRLPAEGRQAASSAETALDSALALVQEARASLESLLAQLQSEPGKLEQIEERLFGLRAAARKYHVPVGGLAGLRSAFETKLAALDGGGASIAAAEAEAAEARAAFRERARELSARRVAVAKRLEEAVARELAPLCSTAVH